MYFPKVGLDNSIDNTNTNTKMAAKHPDNISSNSSAVPHVTESCQPGIPVHECTKNFDLSTPPTTELLLPSTEERVYAFLNSDDDEEWRDEILISVTGMPDADSVIPGPSNIDSVKSMDAHLWKKRASEPRLGPVKNSELRLVSTQSESGVQVDPTEELEEESDNERSESDKPDRPPSSNKTIRHGGVRSEGLVKAKQRIVEFGRSVADVLARPFRQFRRQARRTTENKPTPEVAPREDRDTLKTEKMEEAKVPIDQLINSKQMSKRRGRPGTMSTPAHPMTLDSTV